MKSVLTRKKTGRSDPTGSLRFYFIYTKPKAMTFKILTPHERRLAKSYISPNAFLALVGDALLSGDPLSVVRMGDGERILLNATANADPDAVCGAFDLAWRQRMGIEGITNGLLHDRILRAGNECQYFAPSVSGLTQPAYDLYRYFEARDKYVDNFFVNVWDQDAKAELFKAAGRVLLLHGNRGLADAMQIRARDRFGVKVEYLELSSWQQAELVSNKALISEAKLVLFAGGPASKYIAEKIAEMSAVPKVVLDLGNTTDKWTFA